MEPRMRGITATWHDVREAIVALKRGVPAPSVGADGIETTAFLQLLADLWSKCSLNYKIIPTDSAGTRLAKLTLSFMISPACATVLTQITELCADKPTLTREQVTTIFATLLTTLEELYLKLPDLPLSKADKLTLQGLVSLLSTLRHDIIENKFISDKELIKKCEDSIFAEFAKREEDKITDLTKQIADLQAKQNCEKQLREEAEARALTAERKNQQLQEKLAQLEARLKVSKHKSAIDDYDDDELSTGSSSFTETAPDDRDAHLARINSTFTRFGENFSAVGGIGWLFATYARRHFAPLTSRTAMEEKGLTSCDGNAPIGNLMRLATLVQKTDDPDDKLKRALLAQSLYALNQYQSTQHLGWLKAYRGLIDIAAITTKRAITSTDEEKAAVDADAVNFFTVFRDHLDPRFLVQSLITSEEFNRPERGYNAQTCWDALNNSKLWSDDITITALDKSTKAVNIKDSFIEYFLNGLNHGHKPNSANNGESKTPGTYDAALINTLLLMTASTSETAPSIDLLLKLVDTPSVTAANCNKEAERLKDAAKKVGDLFTVDEEYDSDATDDSNPSML